MKTKVVNRDITTVINQIIENIPPIISDREILVSELKNIINSANYTAPEAMKVRWRELKNTLDYYIGDLDESWKKKINQIVIGESIDESKVVGNWYDKFRIKEKDRDKFQSLVYGDAMIDMRLIMPFLRELTNRHAIEIGKKVQETQVFKDAWNEITKILQDTNKVQNTMGSTLNEYLALLEKQNGMLVKKEETIRELKLKLIDKGVDVD